MSDRDRETLEEMKKILGFDPKDAVETMNRALDEGILAIPQLTPTQIHDLKVLRIRKDAESNREKPFNPLRATFTFTAKDVNFDTLEALTGFDDPGESGGFPEVQIREETDELRQQARLEQYDEEMESCRNIFEDRNAIYKDAFVFLGLQGTVITLIGDCIRLRNMILQTSDHGRSFEEEIEDKLRDVVNQAIISLMMLSEDNFEGQ